MKNIKRAIPLMMILAVLVLAAVSIGMMADRGYGISTGLYLESKDGQALFILDNSPIVMSGRTKSDLFGRLEDGDKILVIHDGIQETYPGRTGVYAVFKVGGGTAGDIPQNVVDQLTESGWLDAAAEKQIPSF